VQLPSLRRKASDVAIDDSVDSAESAVVTTGDSRTRKYTPSKKELGVATPKRKAGGRVVEKPPANRREAMKRAREKQRLQRAEAREGMMAGKEEFMLPRDRGPEKALTRNFVDARRNIATYFLPGALIVVVFSATAWPGQVRLAANLFWFLLALAVIVDSVFLSLKLKKVVHERLPKSTVRMRGLYWYGIMRSLSFRKMRMPAPTVPVGGKY
jgi:hypothetical protein